MNTGITTEIVLWTYFLSDGGYYAVVSIGSGTGDVITIKIQP